MEIRETIYEKIGDGPGKLQSIKIKTETSQDSAEMGIHLYHDGQWHTYTHNMRGFFNRQRSLRRRWFMLGLAVGMLVGVLFGVIL